MLKQKAAFESLEQLLTIYKHVKSMLEKGLMDTGSFMRQWEILMYINQHGRTSVHELASDLGVSKALISNYVGRLVKQDLVWLQEDLEDRRNKHLALTRNGQIKVYQAKQQVIVNMQQLEDTKEYPTLVQQVDILGQYLAKLNLK